MIQAQACLRRVFKGLANWCGDYQNDRAALLVVKCAIDITHDVMDYPNCQFSLISIAVWQQVGDQSCDLVEGNLVLRWQRSRMAVIWFL